MWKKFMAAIGWLFCITLPITLPVAFVMWWNRHGNDCSGAWLPVVAFIAVALVIGHALMAMFWISLQGRKVKNTAPERTAMMLGEDEVVALRKFLSETFGGDLRLETGYRFPNGFRSDLVAVRGRGRYPIMCFEVVEGDNEQRIRDAVRELRFVAEPFVDITRCFVLKKFDSGSTFQLLKVRGGSAQVVGSFAPELRDEIEEIAERRISEVKKRRLRYPILFLLMVVTPIIESVAILAHVQFTISGAVSTLLVFWIGAFLGVFGIGVKGYEPKLADLMS